MGCLISFKWIFGLIGWRIAGGRGFILGFLLGWLLDSLYRRPVVHFTFEQRRFRPGEDAGAGAGSGQQQWQPYVDVTLQEAYRTLGIPETATDDEVRQAYRRLALKYHPDHAAAQGEQARQEAEKMFQRITEARDIIFRARGI